MASVILKLDMVTEKVGREGQEIDRREKRDERENGVTRGAWSSVFVCVCVLSLETSVPRGKKWKGGVWR